MNTVLLLTLIASEIILAEETIRKNADSAGWRVARLITDSSELLLFFAFLISPSVDLGIRFNGLLFLLCLRAFLSLVLWTVSRRKEAKQKKAAGKILSAAGACVLFSSACMPSFIFADYKGLPLTGQYSVALANVILKDESRTEEFENDGSCREIPVYFYYPENGNEKYPLVIFSHGAFGYYQSNTSTYMELASHGYVVASIEHPYHSLFTHDSDGKLIICDSRTMNDFLTIGNMETDDAAGYYETTSGWMKLRKADMNFAADTIKEACISGTDDSWCKKTGSIESVLEVTDTSKIGLMGHSLGGITSVAVGRERNDVGAVIDIDGTMLGEISLCDDKIVSDTTPYPVPVLSFNNEEHQNECDEARKSGYDYVNNTVMDNAEEGFTTCISETEHMDYTDLPMFSPFLAKELGSADIDHMACMTIVNEKILEFFDCYLKGVGHFCTEDRIEL